MKRKSFLLAIVSVFGVRAAQKEEEFNLQEPLVLPVPNGQCPVCVTQAPPYKAVCKPNCQASTIVRCSHCNAAFWQDAEGGK